MQGLSLRSYRKLDKNGQPTTVFVYAVTGTDAELAQYKETQGANYRESDDGEPLWFTTRASGDRPVLLFTSKGQVVPDMSAFDKAASLAKQYGGDLGAELAKVAAAMLVGSKTVAPVKPTVDPVEPPVAPAKRKLPKD